MYRVLIVDDEIDITSTLREGLEKLNLMVTTFNDPNEALEDFSSGKYDVVLLDIRMPAMDGFELYEKIRTIDSEVRVCFMTAYEVYAEALKKLFPETYSKVCFIRKPFAIEGFAKKLKEEMEART